MSLQPYKHPVPGYILAVYGCVGRTVSFAEWTGYSPVVKIKLDSLRQNL